MSVQSHATRCLFGRTSCLDLHLMLLACIVCFALCLGFLCVRGHPSDPYRQDCLLAYPGQVHRSRISFALILSACRDVPVILTGTIDEWPALDKWKDPKYSECLPMLKCDGKGPQKFLGTLPTCFHSFCRITYTRNDQDDFP